jgi:hypothetical protein
LAIFLTSYFFPFGGNKSPFSTLIENGLQKKFPAASSSPIPLQRDCSGSTIGAERLNFRVRDGNGCGPFAIATGKPKIKRTIPFNFIRQ